MNLTGFGLNLLLVGGGALDFAFDFFPAAIPDHAVGLELASLLVELALTLALISGVVRRLPDIWIRPAADVCAMNWQLRLRRKGHERNRRRLGTSRGDAGHRQVDLNIDRPDLQPIAVRERRLGHDRLAVQEYRLGRRELADAQAVGASDKLRDDGREVRAGDAQVASRDAAEEELLAWEVVKRRVRGAMPQLKANQRSARRQLG